MQIGSSVTLIGWKSGQTTYALYGTEWRERGYGLRSIWSDGTFKMGRINTT